MIWRWVSRFMPWPADWRERMAKGSPRAMSSLVCFDSPEQFYDSHRHLRKAYTEKCQEVARLKSKLPTC